MEQMRRTIQKLSSEVIGQIAAGEVVERPASAIKELVENSIDAGATAVTVEIKEGGISYLRVTDNGCGIPSGQIRMAFERHATSKIVRSDDLFDIHTLGFRGEALASIAAVAKVTCTTRTAQEDFGVRTQVEAGQVMDVREAATPVGTTILVQDLFFNTPVRLKFLKKSHIEASFVSDYMLRLILSRPDISFRFVNQGKTVYQSVGDGSIESALYCVYGKDAMARMRKVHGSMNGVILDGYVGVGELARGNRQQQSFFVNNRFFRDGALSKALEAACQGLVMIGKFPCCALYLQLPYQQVDVNVHPNKLEVRFQNAPAIAQAVEQLVKESLREERLEDRMRGGAKIEPQDKKEDKGFVVVPLVQEPEAEPTPVVEALSEIKLEAKSEIVSEIKTEIKSKVKSEVKPGLKEALSQLTPVVIPAMESKPSMREGYAPAAVPRPMGTPPPMRVPERPAAPTPAPQQESLLEPEATVPEFKFIGVVFQTYWLFEAGERLLWVDQHAAHERILYDKLWDRYQDKRVSQRLLSPLLVRLTAQECALVSELKPMMEEAGFEVEPFDETSVAVHAVPSIFGETGEPKELFLEALDEWQSQRGPMTQERMRKQVMQMACKRAIKAGDKLSDAEMKHLLFQMLTTGMMPTCPHGRPIIVETHRRDLEKRFKRIQ